MAQSFRASIYYLLLCSACLFLPIKGQAQSLSPVQDDRTAGTIYSYKPQKKKVNSLTKELGQSLFFTTDPALKVSVETVTPAPVKKQSRKATDFSWLTPTEPRPAPVPEQTPTLKQPTKIMSRMNPASPPLSPVVSKIKAPPIPDLYAGPSSQKLAIYEPNLTTKTMKEVSVLPEPQKLIEETVIVSDPKPEPAMILAESVIKNHAAIEKKAEQVPPENVLAKKPKKEEPVDLQADDLFHNEQSNVLTASGNVVIQQTGRTLKADRISYAMDEDRVIARGNVSLEDQNGDIYNTSYAEMSNKLQDGEIKELKSVLNDGSRFNAQRGERKDGNTTTMHNASYTPCEPCENKPDADPLWQIKADEVIHDQAGQRIEYKNARFELGDVPVMYTPYFAHADGSVDRKSGFISPVLGYKSDMGAFAGPQYYWSIAPDKDATIGVVTSTSQNPIAFGQWRQRWANAGLELNGSTTHASRKRQDGGETVTIEEELRGHINGEARWDMTDKWRSGINVAWASDDQYMRQYDIDDLKIVDENVLENEIYAERFSGRDYFVGRALSFQDIRTQDRREDQPEVLPELIASFKGDPNSVPLIGGTWSVDTSFLGLRREGESQDVNRFSMAGGWNKRMTSDIGVQTDVQALVRGDVYNVRDRDLATLGSGKSDTSTDRRAFANITVTNSMPFAKELETAQVVLEPSVSVFMSSDVENEEDIPNEDSQDIQLDAGNLFAPNRFSGLDRVEDEPKVTYGMLTGIYGHDGSKLDVFIGQSYNLNEDSDSFPEGSGLNDQSSDIVGRVSAYAKEDFGLDYRFQLNNRNMSSQRHEIDAYTKLGQLELSGRYLFAKSLAGTDINQSREQIRGNASYWLSEEWRVNTGATQDLGENPGLRNAYAGLDYIGQCISLSLTGQRNLTDDSSGESDTEIFLRIGLKNLGEFSTAGLQVNNSTE